MNYMRAAIGPFGLALAFAVRLHAQPFLSDGLVANYPFNGNANDASGNGKDGVVYGATPTVNRLGLSDNAYRFNGSSWVQLPSSILPSPCSEVTLSAWVLADGGRYDAQQDLVVMAGGGGNCALIAFAGGLWGFWVKLQSGEGFTLETPMVTNGWAQIVGTFKQGQSIQFWVNGSLVQSNAVPDETLFSDAGFPLNSAIGIYDYVPSPYWGFNGALDDVRIYSRALAASEVQQLYAYETGPRVDLIRAVKPLFSNLALATNYQLQVSADLNTWTNTGSAFTATNTSMVYPQYWDVDNWGKLFFRLQIAP